VLKSKKFEYPVMSGGGSIPGYARKLPHACVFDKTGNPISPEFERAVLKALK
jgi:hypothetical protein